MWQCVGRARVSGMGLLSHRALGRRCGVTGCARRHESMGRASRPCELHAERPHANHRSTNPAQARWHAYPFLLLGLPALWQARRFQPVTRCGRGDYRICSSQRSSSWTGYGAFWNSRRLLQKRRLDHVGRLAPTRAAERSYRAGACREICRDVLLSQNQEPRCDHVEIRPWRTWIALSYKLGGKRSTGGPFRGCSAAR